MPTTTPSRVASQQTQPVRSPEVTFKPLETAEDAVAFRTLNEEWITRYFSLEQKDLETLSDPQTAILNKGGRIYLAHSDGSPVGCVALIAGGNGSYELSKMAVRPTLRGQGIGRRLLEYTIQQARLLGARSLFLGSSTKLQNAVHLYEALGFQHVPPDTLPSMKYARADVFMEMTL